MLAPRQNTPGGVYTPMSALEPDVLMLGESYEVVQMPLPGCLNMVCIYNYIIYIYNDIEIIILYTYI
jgi:hypothetical protein